MRWLAIITLGTVASLYALHRASRSIDAAFDALCPFGDSDCRTMTLTGEGA